MYVVCTLYDYCTYKLLDRYLLMKLNGQPMVEFDKELKESSGNLISTRFIIGTRKLLSYVAATNNANFPVTAMSLHGVVLLSWKL